MALLARLVILVKWSDCVEDAFGAVTSIACSALRHMSFSEERAVNSFKGPFLDRLCADTPIKFYGEWIQCINIAPQVPSVIGYMVKENKDVNIAVRSRVSGGFGPIQDDTPQSAAIDICKPFSNRLDESLPVQLVSHVAYSVSRMGPLQARISPCTGALSLQRLRHVNACIQ